MSFVGSMPDDNKRRSPTMRIGYARVSTADQNLHLPHDALPAAGCERLLSDTVRGARVDRPGLAAALSACRSGDTLEEGCGIQYSRDV